MVLLELILFSSLLIWDWIWFVLIKIWYEVVVIWKLFGIGMFVVNSFDKDIFFLLIILMVVCLCFSGKI